MLEKTLDATLLGGGLFTSLPLFEARKTACRDAGMRPPPSSVVELSTMMNYPMLCAFDLNQ
jgi:hypothetical protein